MPEDITLIQAKIIIKKIWGLDSSFNWENSIHLDWAKEIAKGIKQASSHTLPKDKILIERKVAEEWLKSNKGCWLDTDEPLMNEIRKQLSK